MLGAWGKKLFLQAAAILSLCFIEQQRCLCCSSINSSAMIEQDSYRLVVDPLASGEEIF
jgi:hypothetical protein